MGGRGGGASRAIQASSSAASSKSGTFDGGSLAGQIRLEYRALTKNSGEWVRLSDIRAAFPSVSRADMDAAIGQLAVQPDVRVIPISNRASLSPADKEGAITLGGETKHAILIQR